MPQTLEELLPANLGAEYCYQKAKLTKALENPESAEFDMLYAMVAERMAKANPPLIIPYVEVCISAQCTLNCRDCANFMQTYANMGRAKPMDIEAVKSWVVSFIEAVDHILTFRVMGGEPLMQKQFIEFFKFLLTLPKLQHIQIVSNATLMPKDELLDLMANNNKVSFFFSNYGPNVAPHYKKIIDTCLNRGVMVQTTDEDISWFEMGDTSDRGLNDEQKEAVYKACPNNCRHIWDGEFHHCPRSAHAKYLGLIDVPEQDYVPLTKLDVAERRERIRAMYDAKFIEACNHCGLNKDVKFVKPGIQIKVDRSAQAPKTTAKAVTGKKKKS